MLYEGDHVIDGATHFLQTLVDLGVKFCLLTNNSTATLEQLAAKMAKIGLPQLTEARILTSAYEAVAIVKPKCAYIVGMDGLYDACRSAGVIIANGEDDKVRDGCSVDCVLVGLDRNITYTKLSMAMECIGKGASFVATNTDPQFPMKDCLRPGAGAIVAAVETCTGRKPIVVGKPEKNLFLSAAKHFNVTDMARVVMVGDRIDTDVMGGNGVGMPTVLMQTGIGKTYAQHMLDSLAGREKPTVVVRDMHALTALVAAARGGAAAAANKK